MSNETIKQDFIQQLTAIIAAQTFIKITLSKSVGEDKTLQNIYARLIELKNKEHLSLTFRYTTKDVVKNYSIAEGLALISMSLGETFLHATILTVKNDISILYNKKRKARIFIKKPSQSKVLSKQHNHKKNYWIAENAPYLSDLGIANADGKVLKGGQKKFKQINKYIEIIDGLVKTKVLPSEPHIVDMGSGKGYLTFALYDYLKNNFSSQASITGIELRPHLVDFCNNLAEKINYDNLDFIAQDIFNYQAQRIDMLIALHACDIATDIAIAKGIQSEAAIIVVAPCCHKQIRKAMNCSTDLQAILQHGILAERQAELLTDGMRALIMEGHGYKTKVFEFISTEHTAKNLMIVGTKGKKNEAALEKVARIKKDFGIEEHYLERLLK